MDRLAEGDLETGDRHFVATSDLTELEHIVEHMTFVSPSKRCEVILGADRREHGDRSRRDTRVREVREQTEQVSAVIDMGVRDDDRVEL